MQIHLRLVLFYVDLYQHRIPEMNIRIQSQNEIQILFCDIENIQNDVTLLIRATA